MREGLPTAVEYYQDEVILIIQWPSECVKTVSFICGDNLHVGAGIHFKRVVAYLILILGRISPYYASVYYNLPYK